MERRRTAGLYLDPANLHATTCTLHPAHPAHRMLGQPMTDVHDLQRFIVAQAPVIDRVRAELAAGDKRSHWMWFVFPQIRGLGSSATSKHFAIASRDEARAYLAHPLLGPRLVECTSLVVAVVGRSSHGIFGSPDDLKFHSSMTLFAEVADDPAVFVAALDRFCGGRRDAATLAALGGSAAHRKPA